jgi:hypothetical protein
LMSPSIDPEASQLPLAFHNTLLTCFLCVLIVLRVQVKMEA